jgi:hypothetical protein
MKKAAEKAIAEMKEGNPKKKVQRKLNFALVPKREEGC